MTDFFFSEAPLEISRMIMESYAKDFSFYSLIVSQPSFKNILLFIGSVKVSVFFKKFIEKWLIKEWGKNWRITVFRDKHFLKNYLRFLREWGKTGRTEFLLTDITSRGDILSYVISITDSIFEREIIKCNMGQSQLKDVIVNVSSLIEIDCSQKLVFSQTAGCCCPAILIENIKNCLKIGNYTLSNTGTMCRECDNFLINYDETKAPIQILRLRVSINNFHFGDIRISNISYISSFL